MAKLTARQEEVYQLRKKGLSHAEIGKKLGITEGTSRQTVHEINLRLLGSKAAGVCLRDEAKKDKIIKLREAALAFRRGLANPSKNGSEST